MSHDGSQDEERDNIAFVMERVAKLWAEKLDDETLAIHGRRVYQVFKDYGFRTTEALVAENAKIQNMEQQFSESVPLDMALEKMGLKELNRRLSTLTAEIMQLMSQRNEEQSTIIVGELKQAREALDAHYRAFITYLNAVQEIHRRRASARPRSTSTRTSAKLNCRLRRAAARRRART